MNHLASGFVTLCAITMFVGSLLVWAAILAGH